MIAYAPTGLIYYLSPSYNGSLNDKSVIDLEENQIYQELSKYEWMAVDLGYRGVQNDYPNTAFPFFERTVTLEPKEVEFNKEFKSIRIIVENVIMHIKKWKVCRYVYRSFDNDLQKAQEEHHKVWVVAAGLVNQFIMPVK